jgi:hypothetical protein
MLRLALEQSWASLRMLGDLLRGGQHLLVAELLRL